MYGYKSFSIIFYFDRKLYTSLDAKHNVVNKFAEIYWIDLDASGNDIFF